MDPPHTLPGVKDLFPEHLFASSARSVPPPQPSSLLQLPPLYHRPPTHRLHPTTHDLDHQPRHDARSPKRSYETMLMHAGCPGNGGSPSASDSHPMRIGGGGVGGDSVNFVHRADGFKQPAHADAGAPSENHHHEYAQQNHGDMGASKLRHVCDACGKRFNRPSSLRIHANTHTGAKPHICPFPGCGRAFSVSSNMRRHHRGHARQQLQQQVSSPAVMGAYQYGGVQDEVEDEGNFVPGDNGSYALQSPRDVHRHYLSSKPAGTGAHTGYREAHMEEDSVRTPYPLTPPYSDSLSSPGSQAEEIDEDGPERWHAVALSRSTSEVGPWGRERESVSGHRKHPRGSLSDILGPASRLHIDDHPRGTAESSR